jgi:hypothetical protein
MRLSALPVLALLATACSVEHPARDAAPVKPPEPSSNELTARFATLKRLGVESRAAHVDWVAAADAAAATRLTDPSGTVSLAFALREASPVTGLKRDAVTLFKGALHGADVVHSTREDGVEDFVFFDAEPAREELTYDLDVSKVAGLRLVGDSLELLDAGGAPRLRVERPWVSDADSKRRDASLAVDGCAFDTSPVAPWGRPVTAPGASRCQLRVQWRDVRYPAVVDPSWTTTKGLAGTRYGHAMVQLASGQLFVAGGFHAVNSLGNGPQLICELFDPKTRTWANSIGLPNGRVDLAIAETDDARYVIVGGGGTRPEIYNPVNGGVTRPMDGDASVSPAGMTATTLDSGLVLLVGGNAGAGTLFSAKDMTFTPAGTLTERAFHTATKLDSGQVLIVGGNGTAGALDSAALYDPVKNAFTATGSLAHARASHTAVKLGDGRVLIAGGGDASGELYDPKTGKFSTVGELSGDRASAQALLLQSGHVMVAGGSAGSALVSVDIFDPATETFAAVAPLAVARSQFTAALLATGEAIVVAGKDESTLSLGSVELWQASAPGDACTAKDDCSTGVCQAGICCAEATCTGECVTCAAGTGACVAVKSMDDPDSCTGDLTCNAAGKCTKKNGQVCKKTGECASDLCVDGYCCDSACDGQCQACDVAAKPGTCTAVVGNSHGDRPRCLAFGEPCGGACNGIGVSECAFPSAVTACGASCGDSMIEESTCDGLGACVADSPHVCAGNFACADETSCKTSCDEDNGDADCADEFHCSKGQCVPSAVCEGRVVRKGGKLTDCTPYICEQSGVCKNSCSVVTDCTSPNVCSLDGHCVAPVLSGDISGCAFGRGRSGAAGCLMVALGLALGRLRRPRRSRRERRAR